MVATRLAPFVTLAAMVVSGWAVPAVAGEAVKLSVEFPPDVVSLDPGADLAMVQVVGIDSEGARVGFGSHSAQLDVTVGSVRLVAAPYHFAYTAPPTIEGPTQVIFTATLAGAPSIRGTARLDILPKGRFVRLRVTASADRLDWGKSATVTVQGENREGRLGPVVAQTVKVSLRGPGRVEFVRLGTYRFTAPTSTDGAGQAEVRVRARLAEQASVHGEVAIALGAPGVRIPPPIETRETPDPAGATGGRRTDVPPPPTSETAEERPAETTGAAGEGKPKGRKGRKKRKNAKARAEKANTEDGSGEEPGGKNANKETNGNAKKGKGHDETNDRSDVIWPGGHVRVTAWRGRSNADAAKGMRRIRHMPEPGGEFALRDAQQRIRIVVLSPDVTKVDAEWRIGDAEQPLATPPGSVRTTRNRDDQLAVVVDARPPANGDALRVTLILRRPGGDLREDFVLRRKTAD